MVLIKPRLRDFFSFELCFMLFALSGMYKDAPAIESFGHYVDITVGTMALSMLAALVVLLRHGIPRDAIRWGYLGIYLVFLSAVLLSYLVSGHVDYSTEKLQRTVVFNTWAVLGVLLAVTRREQFETWLRLVMWFAVAASGAALFNSVSSYTGLYATLFGGGGVHELGYVASLGLTVVLGAILFTHNQAERLVLVAAGGAIVFTILLSSTRQSIGAMVVVAGYYFFVLVKAGFRKKQLFWLVVAPALLFFTFQVIRENFLPEVFLGHTEERMGSLFRGDIGLVFEQSLRPRLWEDGLKLWLQHPLLGVGYGNFQTYAEGGGLYPHNYFIELLSETGAFGFLPGFALVAIPFWLAIKRTAFRTDWVGCSLGGMWVAWFTYMMVSGDIPVHRPGFALASLVVAYAAVTRQSGQDSLSRNLPRADVPRCPLPQQPCPRSRT